MATMPHDLLCHPRRTSYRHPVPPHRLPIPAGNAGGAPFGGGTHVDTIQLFHTTSVAADMPWRAAAGEAHPMTPSTVAIPSPAEWDRLDTDIAPPSLLPRTEDIPAYPLPVFDRLILDLGWDPCAPGSGTDFGAEVDTEVDTPEPLDWTNAPTQILPRIPVSCDLGSEPSANPAQPRIRTAPGRQRDASQGHLCDPAAAGAST